MKNHRVYKGYNDISYFLSRYVLISVYKFMYRFRKNSYLPINDICRRPYFIKVLNKWLHLLFQINPIFKKVD